jgi:hypothetical protein
LHRLDGVLDDFDRACCRCPRALNELPRLQSVRGGRVDGRGDFPQRRRRFLECCRLVSGPFTQQLGRFANLLAAAREITDLP